MKVYVTTFCCSLCGRHLILEWPQKALFHPNDLVEHCENAGKRFKLPYIELEEIVR